MNATEVGTLILAAMAVIGSILSVLALSYRVGRLTGKVDTRIDHGEADRDKIWQAIGKLADRMNQHVDEHHFGRK